MTYEVIIGDAFTGSPVPFPFGIALLAFFIYALIKRDYPARIWMIVLSLLPTKPSTGTAHLFPGVETPPDPAHTDAVATEVDRRPPRQPPQGTREKPG